MAFIAATIAYSLKLRLKSAERRIELAPPEARQDVISTIAEWIGVDLNDIPKEQRAKIVLKQLELKSEKQKQTFWLSTLVAILFFCLSTIVVYGENIPFSLNRPNIPVEVSSFTLNSPPELIQSILGIPTAIRDDNERGLQAVFYGDDESEVYVADYRVKGRRIGLFFLSPKSSLQPYPLRKAVSDTTLFDTTENCGPLNAATAHMNLYSSKCGGSEADGRLYYTFFFTLNYNYDPSSALKSKADYDPDKDPCSLWKIKKGFDLAPCPKLAKWPAVAVLVTNSESALKKLTESILQDFDFGELFT